MQRTRLVSLGQLPTFVAPQVDLLKDPPISNRVSIKWPSRPRSTLYPSAVNSSLHDSTALIASSMLSSAASVRLRGQRLLCIFFSTHPDWIYWFFPFQIQYSTILRIDGRNKTKPNSVDKSFRITMTALSSIHLFFLKKTQHLDTLVSLHQADLLVLSCRCVNQIEPWRPIFSHDVPRVQ